MKKALFSMVIVGIVASAASAGQLSMAFKVGDTYTNDIELLPNQTAQLDILFAFEATDSAKASLVDGFGVRVNVWDRDMGLDASPGVPAVMPNKLESVSMSNTNDWDQGSSLVVPGDMTESFYGASRAFGIGAQYLGNGTDQEPIVLASIVFENDGLAVGESVFLSFTEDGVVPKIFNGTNAWNHRWQWNTWGDGQFKIGQGNPGDNLAKYQYHGYEASSPLKVTGIPEPASLALLALGGVALLRRR